jgi:hypothetical protein
MNRRLAFSSILFTALCSFGVVTATHADEREGLGATLIVGAAQSFVGGNDSGFNIDGNVNEYNAEIESDLFDPLYYNVEYTKGLGNFKQTTGSYAAFDRDIVTGKIGMSFQTNAGPAVLTISPYTGFSYLAADNKFTLGGTNVRSGQDSFYVPLGFKALVHADDISVGVEVAGMYKFKDDQRVIPLDLDQSSKDTVSLQAEVPVRFHITDASFIELKYTHRRDDFRQVGGTREADIFEHKFGAGYGVSF